MTVMGALPSGQPDTARLRVPRAGALVVVKAHAMVQPARSHPERDAHDISALLRTDPEGPEAIARELAAVPAREEAAVAVDIIDALVRSARAVLTPNVLGLGERGCSRAYGYVASLGAFGKMALSSGQTGSGRYDEPMVTKRAPGAERGAVSPLLEPGL
jgi:outer membrane protein TolC